jgi:GNAT superfamily N-acetyltransferase
MQISRRRYDHPDVAKLVTRLQAEYVLIYGGPDNSPTSAGQFEPPAGAFGLGYNGDTPAAMGGWRLGEDGRSELKRMYVPDEYRGRGYSRAVLLWLEDFALSAGAKEVVLETNQLHPAAVGVYRSSGYTEVPAFGHFADDPMTVYLGRTISSGAR